jgi:hypothetical protein
VEKKKKGAGPTKRRSSIEIPAWAKAKLGY